MSRVRKQTHTDFQNRLKRVDPAFHRSAGAQGTARDVTRARPFAALLMGFFWAYLVISVSNNRDVVQSSLIQGALPEHLHGIILMTLAGLLAMSVIMLAFHVFRFLTLRKSGKKKNSGALLMGVLGALMLVYTPASVWQTGFGMMDVNSRSFVMAASDTVKDVMPGVDFGTVAFVSSIGK